MARPKRLIAWAQEALSRVDNTAPQDPLVTEDGRTVRPHQTPVLDVKLPGTGITISQHPKHDLGTGTTVKTQNGDVKSAQQVYEGRQRRALGTKEQGQDAAQELMDDALQYVISQKRFFCDISVAQSHCQVGE